MTPHPSACARPDCPFRLAPALPGARSRRTAIVYQHDDLFALPTFRTLERLRYRGTRSMLEDEDLQVSVYSRREFYKKDQFIGSGSVSLEGASTGVSTTTPIAWRRSARQARKANESFVPSGQVTGAVSVTARNSPLWREFSQTGNVNPPELKVYPPFEYCYLCVRIVNARGLMAVDEDAASDPYVSCTWAGQTQSTSVHFNNLNPDFDETLYFRVRSFENDVPSVAEVAKHPFIRIAVWDYDEGGSSDDLGMGKFFLHHITGAPWRKEGEVDKTFKPNVPRRRTVFVRDRVGGPLRQRQIMTRQHKARIKLEGLDPWLTSTVKVEAWFHGPGYVDETGKPQVYSKNTKTTRFRQRRGGDLLELNEDLRKLHNSPLLYLPKFEDRRQPKRRSPNDEVRMVRNQMTGRMEEEEEEVILAGSNEKWVQEAYEQFNKRWRAHEQGARLRAFNREFPLVCGPDQYGQMFLLPQFLQAIPVPAQLFSDSYERSRTVCLDSQKPQSSWNIARFIHCVEWTFKDDNEREYTDQMGGEDAWVSPEYFTDMKKSGVSGHAVMLCSLLIGLKVDAWVCVGRAKEGGQEEDNGFGVRKKKKKTKKKRQMVMAGNGESKSGGDGGKAGPNDSVNRGAVATSAEGSSSSKTRHHVWVMTRESNSLECTYKFKDNMPDQARRRCGSIKFWETTCRQVHICPQLANRWEGRDEEEMYRKAMGAKAKRKKKKKKVESSSSDDSSESDSGVGGENPQGGGEDGNTGAEANSKEAKAARKLAKAKAKAKAKRKKARKRARKRIKNMKPKEAVIAFDNSDSEDYADVPDEIDMLSYDHTDYRHDEYDEFNLLNGGESKQSDSAAASRIHNMGGFRDDCSLGVNDVFVKSAGIGTQWGKPDHRITLRQKADAEAEQREAEKRKADRSAQLARRRKLAAMSKAHAERVSLGDISFCSFFQVAFFGPFPAFCCVCLSHLSHTYPRLSAPPIDHVDCPARWLRRRDP